MFARRTKLALCSQCVFPGDGARLQRLVQRPAHAFHFTPTSASWLNLVKRFFSELTERQLRRLEVTRVDELVAAITHYIDRRDENPKPFVWTATVRQIMKKVNKANETLATLH